MFGTRDFKGVAQRASELAKIPGTKTIDPLSYQIAFNVGISPRGSQILDELEFHQVHGKDIAYLFTATGRNTGNLLKALQREDSISRVQELISDLKAVIRLEGQFT